MSKPSKDASGIDKADIANYVAAGLIVSAMGFAIVTQNTQLVTTAMGAGIGYLFGKAAKNGNK